MLLYISIALCLLVLIVYFFVGYSFGFHKGIKFGNQIANHLGMRNKFFHVVLENGVNGGQSLMVLGALAKAEFNIERASVELGPSLMRGLYKLEERFGQQKEIDDAKPIATRLFYEWEKIQLERAKQ